MCDFWARLGRGARLAIAAGMAAAMALVGAWLASPWWGDDLDPGTRARRAHARVGSTERAHAPGLVAAGQEAFRAARAAEREGRAAEAADRYLEAAEQYERALAVARGAASKRVLTLPADRSLGTLSTRPDPSRPWREVGPASGSVGVPAGEEVRLSVVLEFGDADIDTLLAWPPGTLQSLDLGQSRVTDAGLEKVARLDGLNDLSLLGTAVGDEGVSHLKRLPTLKYLNLGRTRVTDASLPVIAALPVLESLNAQSTGFTGALVPVAATREALRVLLLDDAQASDEAIPLLAGLKKLEWLSIGGPRVTDAGVDHLVGMTQLTSLQLMPSGITDEGIRRLRRELKNCKVRD